MHKTARLPEAAAFDYNTVAEVLAELEAKARGSVLPDSGDHVGNPAILTRRAERLIRLLVTEAAEELRVQATQPGYVNPLLRIPRSNGLLWADALNRQVERCHQAVVAPGARTTVTLEATAPTLAEVFEACVDVRNRVIQACEGSEPKSAEALAALEAILGGRRFTPSRPAWKNELRTIREAIRTPGPHQTDALLALIPLIDEVLELLDEARQDNVGRARTIVRWNEEVVVTQGTLALLISEFVKWSAAHASRTLNGQIRGIANPRRRGDEVGLSDPGPRDGEAGAKKSAGESPADEAAAASPDEPAASAPQAAASEPGAQAAPEAGHQQTAEEGPAEKPQG